MLDTRIAGAHDVVKASPRPRTPALELWRKHCPNGLDRVVDKAALIDDDLRPIWRAACVEAEAMEWHERAIWHDDHGPSAAATQCHSTSTALLAKARAMLAEVAT